MSLYFVYDRSPSRLTAGRYTALLVQSTGNGWFLYPQLCLSCLHACIFSFCLPVYLPAVPAVPSFLGQSVGRSVGLSVSPSGFDVSVCPSVVLSVCAFAVFTLYLYGA